jgi:hypothetical protein
MRLLVEILWNSIALNVLWSDPITWYTQSSGAHVLGSLLLIQSPTWAWMVYMVGLQGIPAIMISLQLLLDAWKFIPSADRFFHSSSSGHQRSLILVQPELVKAHLSPNPLIPNGLPFELVMRGLPKRGCLRISATLVESDLVRPDLTLIHAPKMLFQMEHGTLLNFEVVKIQLMSDVLGPLPCTGSVV